MWVKQLTVNELTAKQFSRRRSHCAIRTIQFRIITIECWIVIHNAREYKAELTKYVSVMRIYDGLE